MDLSKCPEMQVQGIAGLWILQAGPAWSVAFHTLEVGLQVCAAASPRDMSMPDMQVIAGSDALETLLQLPDGQMCDLL